MYASWSYRIVRFPINALDDFYFALCEVYLDADGEIAAWSPTTVSGFDDLEDLDGTLELMSECAHRDLPVLEAPSLPGYEAWKREA